MISRLGAALVAPRRALAAADHPDDGGRAGSDAAVLVGVALVALHARALVAAGWIGLASGLGDLLAALLGALGRALAADFTFLLAGAAALHLLAGARRSLGRDLDLVCVAYVPLAAVRLGAALLFWLSGAQATRAAGDVAGLIGYGWAGAILVLGLLQARARREPPPAPPPLPRRAAWAGAALGALAGALIALQAAWIARHHQALRPVSPGDRAPTFALPRLDGGGTIDLAGLAGRVVLVDFWATWCGPCRDTMPAIERVYRRLHGRGLEVVSVDTEGWAAAGQARALVRGLGLTFPVVVDEHGEAWEKYKVSTIPHLLLIDRRGVVRAVHRGGDAGLERELTRQVESLLAE